MITDMMMVLNEFYGYHLSVALWGIVITLRCELGYSRLTGL